MMAYQQINQTGSYGTSISRRFFLNLGIDALVLRPVLAFQDTDVNKWYDAFPAEIPGAAKVDKSVRTPGASHVLVHIRQKHYRPEIDEKGMQEVNQVQDDIYKILSHLSSRNVVKRVYDEGVTSLVEMDLRVHNIIKKDIATRPYNFLASRYQEMIKRYQSMLNDEEGIKSRYPNQTEAENFRQQIRAEIDKTKLNLEELTKLEERAKNTEAKLQQVDKEFERKNGAVARLHNEGRLEVIAAEEYEQQLRADIAELRWFKDVADAIDRGERPNYELPPEIMDQREDILLNLVSQNRDQSATSVYGALHDWRNNVNLWNSQHPDQRFSLIVVTPLAYEEQERAKKQ